MKSKFFSINLNDFGKGLLMAVIAVIVTAAWTLIGSKPGYYGTAAEWGVILHSGVVTGLAYIVKNLFTNSDGEAFSSEK